MKTCSICGYEAKHQGALNMHMYHCKMKHREQIDNVEIERGVECSHKFRLLNLQSPIERQANQNGYMEVCSKCQELR